MKRITECCSVIPPSPIESNCLSHSVTVEEAVCEEQILQPWLFIAGAGTAISWCIMWLPIALFPDRHWKFRSKFKQRIHREIMSPKTRKEKKELKIVRENSFRTTAKYFRNEAKLGCWKNIAGCTLTKGLADTWVGERQLSCSDSLSKTPL